MVYERCYPVGPFELADPTGIGIGYNITKEAGARRSSRRKSTPEISDKRMDEDSTRMRTGTVRATRRRMQRESTYSASSRGL
jgi:enoyl-CoA hydratase/3-hydroxyacyl-CoA dehydrogenase